MPLPGGVLSSRAAFVGFGLGPGEPVLPAARMRTVHSGTDLVYGLGFSSYRSFTEPGVPLAPLGKVNLLAGQNNAGKSNVLRFLRDYFWCTADAVS